MTQFADIYRGRRVLITGHTGFKGSWLALWLSGLGAEITGMALPPATEPNHWDMLSLNIVDLRQDIRDADKVRSAIKAARPEIVFHLAAQPLVRRSYRDPLGNWATNVMGTANVLEACRQTESVHAILAVTTDKVYANQECSRRYRENDRLGGHDPYSASKAACELLIESYRKAFFHEDHSPLLASARAGNVIGGGDWSEDRLIPDLIRAVSQRKPVVIRSPNAIRPWQHTLECLTGYLLLGQKLLEGRPDFVGAWNFGPEPEDNRKVEEVLTLLQSYWPELSWQRSPDSHPHEATLLYLDNAKSKEKLGWQPVWGIAQAIQATADWYREQFTTGLATSKAQLLEYVDAARSAGASWVTG